jgi:RimJ/RimL family protein N-acetyltransferase
MVAAAWTQGVTPLCGDLVTVREVLACDVPTLFELLTDPAVSDHVSTPPPTIDAFAGFVTWAHHQREAGKGVCFGIVPRGLDAAVGIIQVRALDRTFFSAEWGFALGAAFWGTGVFMEAANLVAGFAFETLGVHRIEARAVCQNGRGNAVLQKLGAQPEARLEQSFCKGDRQDRQFLWTLREQDWRQRPLVQERFSPLHATEHIAQAVQHVRRVLHERPRDTTRAADPFPFFLTE